MSKNEENDLTQDSDKIPNDTSGNRNLEEQDNVNNEHTASDNKESPYTHSAAETDGPSLPQRSPSMTYEDMFDLTGHGRFNFWALIATSLFLWYSAIETLSMAYVLTPIECDLALSVAEKGLISSGCYIGLLFTGLCWGGITDKYGRKKVIVPTVISCLFFSFLSSMSTNFWAMFFFRVIVGTMLSASFSTVLVYLGEVNTRAYRDKAVSWAITISVTLFIVIPALAWAIIPGRWTINIHTMIVRPWRVFMWMWSLIGGMAVLILIFLPESPRFLYAAKGIRAALPAVVQIFAWNKKKKKEEFPVITLASTSTTILDVKEKTLKETVNHMSLLLRKPMLMPMLITHFCMFIVHLTVFGLYMWLPDIFYATMQHLDLKISMCDIIVIKYGDKGLKNATRVSMFSGGGDTGETCAGLSSDMYPVSMLAEFVFMLPYFGLSLLIHRINKIHIYSVTLGVSQVLFVMSAFIRQPIVAMILIIFGTASAVPAILTAMADEVFPTTLRATAMCTMFMAGEIGTILGANLMPLCALSVQWCWGLFICVAIANLASCVWIEVGWPNVEQVRAIMEERGFPY
ncbi:synaptic vesicle glycoprotein 2B-like [Hyposmocoma kahamanoa]|uniref:synaptic vesicle glycoprotein 2B-like n=1 Tax=Hyposmocoma kahamanoa TaxID=1477025 RepID=UPI000E6D5D82|nr:synaptic vesicle glycoprotein 2B-like [Hyposmocoma kahamanoa]